MNLSREQIEIINRCRKSVTFFLTHFCKIKHPSAGILPFRPFKYQKYALECFRKYRLNIFRKCRQSGASKISGAFATWFALFHPHKRILIVSRVNEDAMGFLRENIVFLYEHLPDWMRQLWKPIKQNEHEITFPNGSVIKSLTSHPDVLRSNASSLNIIDEAAFIQGMDILWAGGWSTLQHGGNVIVVSTCVAPDTLVMTADGLKEIKDLAPDAFEGKSDGYYHSNYNGPQIVGVDGLESATKFYKRDAESTKIITTSCNYQLEASTRHKLMVINNDTGESCQKFVDELSIGDFLPVKAGHMVFGGDDNINYVDYDKRYKNRTKSFVVDKIDCDLAYLLGVITAEGHVRTENVLIACGDDEVLSKCEKWGGVHWKRGRKNQHYVTQSYSPMFVRFLNWLGVENTTASHKTIPHRLLKCSEPIIRHFLRGLFDGDGCSSTKNRICLTSTSLKLIKQVRMLLFNYGMHTYLDIAPPGTTKFNRGSHISEHPTKESYRLYVSSMFYNKFYDSIGFGIGRKNDKRQHSLSNSDNVLMPSVVKKLLNEFRKSANLTIEQMVNLGISNNVLFGKRTRITKARLKLFLGKANAPSNQYFERLSKLCEYDWFNVVAGLKDSSNEVYDFTLPRTHTFIGDCFININTNGVGNWYWGACTDAEAGVNGFNPIVVNWWDMDWAIEYTDPLSKSPKRIAPCDGVRKCRTPEEINKYGQYWSPWLEEQYRALQEQGESWKFQQEVLASFIGSGHTVLPKEVIAAMELSVEDPLYKVAGTQTYIHPVSGEAEELDFSFQDPEEGLWVWKQPVLATPDKRRADVLIEKGAPAHSYVCGVDIATGKGKDYSAIEVFDLDTMEQVAEFMARVIPRELVRFIDRIARWYNCAALVIERNNGGDIVIDEMRYNMMYPKLWRKKDINDKPAPASAKTRRRARPLKVSPYGFMTTQSSKAALNKYMLDCFRDGDGGYAIYSRRLLKQFNTYVRKRDRVGRDTNRTEAEDGAGNFDDLVMATALALVALSDGLSIDPSNLMPTGSNSSYKSSSGPIILTDAGMLEAQESMADKGGSQLLMPMSMSPEDVVEVAAQRVVDAFTLQLGGIPMSGATPVVVPSKFFYEKKDRY